MVDVRLARLNDGPELARLRWQYAAEGHASVTPLPEFQAEFLGFLALALESGRWGIWVAEADHRLVGTLSVQLIDRAPRPVPTNRWKGYITSAYVEPPSRNGGIGRALLDAAVAWARERGAGSCVVWPSQQSVPFYRRAGFGATEALELRPLQTDTLPPARRNRWTGDFQTGGTHAIGRDRRQPFGPKSFGEPLVEWPESDPLPPPPGISRIRSPRRSRRRGSRPPASLG